MTKLKQLLSPLLMEYQKYMQVKIPDDVEKQKKMYRSLVNVREPGMSPYIDEEWLEMQDAFLQEEMTKKQIVDAMEFPTIQKEFGIAVKPMYLQEQMKKDAPFTIFHSDRIALWQGDITQVKADAIVNAANSKLLGCFIPCHGCVDNAIHTAAGSRLREECAEIMKEQGREEPVGFVKVTKGYNLPCQYVMHTVGPIVNGFLSEQEETELTSCYRACLEAAEERKLTSIVFPSISTGEFHFPKKRAADLALREVDEFLDEAVHLKKVVFCVYSKEDRKVYEDTFALYRK